MKMFTVAGYHAVVCDAFISVIFSNKLMKLAIFFINVVFSRIVLKFSYKLYSNDLEKFLKDVKEVYPIQPHVTVKCTNFTIQN